MLQLALENEVEEYTQKHFNFKDQHGKRAVVKNGYMQKRYIVTGIDPIAITQPRLDDLKLDKKKRFSINILSR